jgi:hypothetical protein
MNTYKFTNQKNQKETFINGDKCSKIGSYYKVFIYGRAEEIGSFYHDTYLMEELPYDSSKDTVDYFDFGPMTFYDDIID